MQVDRIRRLLGTESRADETARALRAIAHDSGAATVGAVHLTCADEFESTAADAFQRDFVRHLLPPTRLGHRAPLRLANLGAQYEPGAVPIAEQHFSTPQSVESFKLIVVKVNAHVARADERHYGTIDRYDVPSQACGALAAMLSGVRGGAPERLRTMFNLDGIDRVNVIRKQHPPPRRPLVAAIVNACLQARAASLDAASCAMHSPTVFLVVSGVSIHATRNDTELVCGCTIVDRRGKPAIRHLGLGTDPAAYAIRHDTLPLRVEDPELLASCQRASADGGQRHVAQQVRCASRSP